MSNKIKCKYDKCNTLSSYDYCAKHKCYTPNCNNYHDYGGNNYEYCSKCVCKNVKSCNGLIYKNSNICETCIVRKYYSKINWANLSTCKYKSCHKNVSPNNISQACQMHTCCIESCFNMLPNDVYYPPNYYYQNFGSRYEPNFNQNLHHDHLCIFHWSPDMHFYYPNSFKKSVLTLLKVLKKIEFETGLRIPKFVKFEIFKKI